MNRAPSAVSRSAPALMGTAPYLLAGIVIGFTLPQSAPL